MINLVEIDSLEATVIIDNELDIMSAVSPELVKVNKGFGELALTSPHHVHDRGSVAREMRMSNICCSAHGLSILLKATKGDVCHSMLFDAGPEAEAWARNAQRLKPDLASVEMIQLSHWHPDHSGGMLKAIELIRAAKMANSSSPRDLQIDLHPSRPDYRGFQIPERPPVSLEADPSFDEIEAAGGKVLKMSKTHTVLDDFFLVSGEVPRVTEYEKGVPGGIRFSKATGSWEPDELIMDERFLMCNVKGKGLVLFTRCSHAGAINACKHGVSLMGETVPLHAVVGGLHLAPPDSPIKQTVEDLKALNPAIVLAGHCSGWRVKFEVEKELPGRLVPCSVGLKYTF